jgi:hypothetical protein
MMILLLCSSSLLLFSSLLTDSADIVLFGMWPTPVILATWTRTIWIFWMWEMAIYQQARVSFGPGARQPLILSCLAPVGLHLPLPSVILSPTHDCVCLHHDSPVWCLPLAVAQMSMAPKANFNQQIRLQQVPLRHPE